jgi:uncharacterized glyoxalase superfamily protein PhnB
MTTPSSARAPRVKGIAPQFLVDDLEKAIGYYRDELGFDVDFVYQSVYAGVSRDGASIHLKRARKTIADRAHRKSNDHSDAYVDVSNVDALFADLTARNAKVTKRLEDQPWQCRDFWVEDLDGYILCFSEGTA